MEWEEFLRAFLELRRVERMHGEGWSVITSIEVRCARCEFHCSLRSAADFDVYGAHTRAHFAREMRPQPAGEPH